MSTLRLLTLNARAIPGNRDALTRLISDARPDLVVLHGSPSLLRWRSISAALARRSGLVVVGGGRTAGANLIMSTLGVDVTGTQDVLLGGSALRPAGAALAVLRRGGTEFVMAAARFVGDPAARAEQAGRLEAAVAGLRPDELPSVLSVDGLAGPGTPAWQVVAAKRTAHGSGLFVASSIAVRADTGPAAPAATLQVELTFPV